MAAGIQGEGKKKPKDGVKTPLDKFNHFVAPHGLASVFSLKTATSTDAYLLAVFLTGVVQFLYVLLVGTFPFNAFLAGFLSCVTSFVLGVCLKKTNDFKGFLFAHLVLHIAVLQLIG